MSECKTDECCETGKKESSDACTMAQEIYGLAKQAKFELLKEKMKAAFEAKIGKRMDAVAEIAAEAVIAYFEHQKAGKEACDDYHEKLSSAMKA